MSIVETVKELQLPLGSYVVFGSSPMAVHELRDSSDIDLLDFENLYEKMKDDTSWNEKIYASGDRALTKDNLEIFDSWKFGDYRPEISELIENAEIIDGIPFVQLPEVLKW